MTDTPPPGRTQQVARLFDSVADTYDQVGVTFFEPIARLLVDAVSPRPGQRALDLGCGRGAATVLLAEAVGTAGTAGTAETGGTAGTVTAVDLAPRMVEATAAICAERDLTVQTLVGDVAAPDLETSSYDVVTASLVVFFLPDPAAAVSAWHDLLVPGGRLGVTTFGEQSPVWAEVDALFRPYLPPHMLDPRTSGQQGPFTSPEATTALIKGAGLAEVTTTVTPLPVRFASTEQWAAWSWSHGQRAMWLSVPEEEREPLREKAVAIFGPHLDAHGGLTVEQEIRVTVGTAT